MMIEGFLRTLSALRPPRITVARCGLIVALLGVLGATHHLGGAHIGLYAFFVLPCAFAAWSTGLGAGIIAAVASAAIILASDLVTQVDAPPTSLSINAALRLGLYALVSWGTDTIGRLLERLEQLSLTDSLTGLANRREFFSRGVEEIQRAKRTHRPFSLLFLDLDNFKAVNDKFGHSAGDALLVRVGVVLRAKVRDIDVPARMGGDEFAVLLPETDGNGAQHAGQMLLQKLRIEFASMKYPVTSSIGAATFTQPPATFDDAVKCADELMYQVKKDSKDAVVQRSFSPP